MYLPIWERLDEEALVVRVPRWRGKSWCGQEDHQQAQQRRGQHVGRWKVPKPRRAALGDIHQVCVCLARFVLVPLASFCSCSLREGGHWTTL